MDSSHSVKDREGGGKASYDTWIRDFGGNTHVHETQHRYGCGIHNGFSQINRDMGRGEDHQEDEEDCSRKKKIIERTENIAAGRRRSSSSRSQQLLQQIDEEEEWM